MEGAFLRVVWTGGQVRRGTQKSPQGPKARGGDANLLGIRDQIRAAFLS